MPEMYIDSVATSRFDHAKNAYDFGLIPGDGKWYNGKKGDVHPLDTSLPPSHDYITCKTGAQISDPLYCNAYSVYNPNVYSNSTNTVMYPYDSSFVKINGKYYYYNYYGYGAQRNLWYSFCVKGKGSVTVTLNSEEQKLLYGKNYNFKFSIYESDENVTLSLDSLKKLGKLDSTLSSGLKFIANDYLGTCYYTDFTETFTLPACGSIKPVRYYVVVDINNYSSFYSTINQHVSLQIKYDSANIPDTKYDTYSTANHINGLNEQNLLINGNAEKDKSNGWNTTTGYWYQQTNSIEGTYSFMPYYNGGSSSTELSQTVDVSHYKSYIDAGKATGYFTGYVQSQTHSNPDETQIVLEYLDSSNGVLASVQSGFKAQTGSWLKESLSKVAPSKTRKLKIKLQSMDKNSDAIHNCYFDDMELLLKVDTIKAVPSLKSGIVYKGNSDYFTNASIDSSDFGRVNSGCGGNSGTVWYKFKVDSSGYIYYNMLYAHSVNGKLVLTNEVSENNIRLYKNIIPGDSLSGLVYQPYQSYNYDYNSKMDFTATNCVSPGWYYFQINKCNLFQCSDFAYPRILFNFHHGDYCNTAIPIRIDTLESVTKSALVNCHTIGTDFGEDGSNMGCLFGPEKYKSTWFLVDYSDTAKVDLEFRLAENTSAKPSEIRYRAFYGNCQSLTPAPCNNNALTTFTLDCIRKGTYYVQIVTPANATGTLDMTSEAKKNVDTTCLPINIFKPNAVFYYNTSCPENIVEFINTSTRGDSIKYQWDFGYNNQKSSALNPTFAYPAVKQEKDYDVKLVVTNITRGGKDSLELTVTVPFAPELNILNNDTAICAGDSIVLKSNLTHGKGIWSTGDTSRNIVVKTTGLYTYTVQESPKILINGNAESNPTSKGWTALKGTWSNTSSYLSSAQDSSYFFASISSSTTAELYQDVNISKDSLLVDAGLAKTSLISYIQSYPETKPDQNQIILEYLDAKNNLLAVYQSGALSNVGTWLQLVHSRTTPKKTRKLKVRLQVINADNTTQNYAFFDNIILKMRSACNYFDSVYVQVNQTPLVTLGKDSSFCWHDSVKLKPKITYSNPYLVYEPMNTTYLKGTLTSAARYTAADKYVILTPTTSYVYGNIEWDLNALKIKDTFDIYFEFQSGVTTSCKYGGINLFLFNSSSPTSYYQNNGGYSIIFDEYSNQIQISWQNSRIRTTNVSAPFNNKSWHKIKIVYTNKRFMIYMDGKLIDNFLDTGSRTQTGNKAGISATNNYYGCAMQHLVRKFYLSKKNPYLVEVPTTAGPSITYKWSDAKTDSSRIVKSTKLLSLIITDNNKCKSKPDTVKATSIKTYDSLLTAKEKICSELDTFKLTPLVKGGTFFGNKAVNNRGVVKTDSASAGQNKYYYTLNDKFGCKYIDTAVFTIDSVPYIKITAVNPVCRNGSPFKLKINNPIGFFYGGTYIDSNGLFIPNKTIKRQNKVYYRSKGVNCVGIDSLIVIVDSIPNAAITAAGPFCKNAGIKTLQAKVNSGGKFSGGSFIDSSGKFNPNTASIGNNKVYYSFTDGNKCSNKDSILVRVNAMPSAAINSAGPFCKNGSIQTLSATTNTGGVFSGGAYIESNGKFDPRKANRGSNKVYYTFTDANACTSKDSITVRVDTIPNAAITQAGPVCKNGGTIVLKPAFNAGGTFSGGSYVNSSGTFNPSSLTKGNYKVYYTFTDGNKCTNKDSISIRVDSIPNAAITAAGPFCKNAGIKTLQAKVNSGGKFSGGSFIDSAGKFNPNTASIGNNKVYYAFTDGNKCSNKDSILIRVNAMPSAAINSAGPFCKNASIQTLSATTNTGGVFSGGAYIETNGKFDPRKANIGSNKVYYTFTDANACTSKDSISVRVDTIPNAAITQAGPVCKNGGTIALKPAFNAGGTFSGGSYVNSSGTFNPSSLTKGNYKVYYTFTDGNKCTNKDSISIRVDSIPNAAITSAGPFCKNAGIQTLQPKVNAGGKFSGGSFIDSSGKFNPNTASIGNNKVYYAFTDGNKCSNKDSILIRVNAMPSAAINSAGPFCKNGNVQTLSATTNAGGVFSGGAYIEINGKFDPRKANRGSNKVYYTFTDANSCTSKDSISVRVDTIPNAAITQAGPVCKNGGTIALKPAFNAGGTFSGGSYVNSSGTFNPSSLSKGNYKVYYTFTDGNKCTNKDSISIRVDSIPNAAINAAGPFCKNAGIQTLQAKVNSGGKFSGGSFIDSSGKFNPFVADYGILNIYYTFKDGNKCVNRDSIQVKVDSIPNAAINAAGPFCKNSGIKILTPFYNAGGKFSGGNYIDSNGNLNPLLANHGLNSVYYTFTDGNQCTNTDSIQIHIDSIPVIGLNNAGPFCNLDNSFDLTSRNIGLKKVFSGGSFVDSSGKFFPKLATIGTQKIFVIGTDSKGCRSGDSIEIEVRKVPDASINPVSEICEDSSNIKIAPVLGGGFFFGGLYVSDSGTFYPPIAKAGVHKVYYQRIVDGCSAKDSIQVIVRPLPSFNLSISPQSGCEPLSVLFNSNSVDSNFWQLNDTVLSKDAAFSRMFMAGSYPINLKMSNQYGCVSELQKIISVYAKPVASFTHSPTEIFTNFTTVDFTNQSKDNIVSSNWFVGGTLFADTKDASHNFTDTGTFNITLIVKNEDGCADTALEDLYVLDDFKVFVPNVITPNNDGTNDFFFPAGVGIDKFNMEIYNRWGQMVFKGSEKWDGMYLDDFVLEAYYVYLITIIDVKGVEHKLKGTFIVYR